jgi:hypothetical protein
MQSGIWARWLAFLTAALVAAAADEVTHYDYDAAGRLVGAGYFLGGTNAAIRYAYDANGNRTNSITIARGDPVNTDGDDLRDADELACFGHLGETGSGDPDGDGLTNADELALGGDPSAPDTDGDGMDDRQEAIAGTALNDGGIVFAVARIETASGGAGRVWWNAAAGRTYQIQTRTSLRAGDWSAAGPPRAVTVAGPCYSERPYATNAFFRIKVWVTP